MVNENIKTPQVPKYEEIKYLEESEQERLIRESYEIELDSYNNIEISRGYGPCLVGDMSNCLCSKEELERQKAWIELQREREKLEDERKQRNEKEAKESQERMERIAKKGAVWPKWESTESKRRQWEEWKIANKAYLEEQKSRLPWNRDSNWQAGLPKPKE